MKESAEIEAITREGASARASDEDSTQSASAGSAPARTPAVSAKPAAALGRRTEPESPEDGPEPARETAEPPALEPDEAEAGDEADQPPEESELEQAASAPGSRFQPTSAPRVTPRPMAPPETFAEGDYVVYPTHGVGRVEKIATEEIAGHKLELIHITFEENRMTLRVPVAKARTAGLRKLATRHMFDKALDVLRGRARIKRTMWSRRAQEYEAKINSGDPLSIAEVVRDLHRNAGQPDQSFSERQIYESAMDRLAAELAALDRTDKAAAATKLAEFLKTVG
ncbi:MAG TPA: CarD family transcriptional regulator [Acetobacteraceae bacterium]|jgi:CarD family transcriptional regulator|nr:CarD family transcriptional regulator [Acetobacteraceae bacterium]